MQEWFPDAPGLPKNSKTYLKHVEDITRRMPIILYQLKVTA